VFSWSDHRSRLWPKTSKFGAFSGQTRGTIVAVALCNYAISRSDHPRERQIVLGFRIPRTGNGTG
jgi:hypothetical protein